MNNKFYYAILSKPLRLPSDAKIFETQSRGNGILKKNLRRLAVNHKYRIIRIISRKEVMNSGYHHLDQWITRLKNDTAQVKKWLQGGKRRMRCLK